MTLPTNTPAAIIAGTTAICGLMLVGYMIGMASAFVYHLPLF
ncbi:MAG TPA: hypothetical protein VKA63_02675 [Candidatus Krumholzibacteria bacterium]|nr:hypothetical protein [Candidatus Krumholzibacteria bacterium]